MKKLFNIYADRLEDNVPTKMSRRSWMVLLDDSDVLTHLAMNSRRYSTMKWEEIGANDEIDYARICGRNIFDQSTMFFIDALNSTDPGLRFIDFVESLSRLSELLMICADKRPLSLKLNDTWNEFFRPLLDIDQSPNRLMAEAIEAFVVLNVGVISEQRTRRMAFHRARLSEVQVRIQKARQIIRRNALARRNWSKLITPLVRKGRCLYGKEVFKLTEFAVEEIECANPPGISIGRSQLPFWMRNLK